VWAADGCGAGAERDGPAAGGVPSPGDADPGDCTAGVMVRGLPAAPGRTSEAQAVNAATDRATVSANISRWGMTVRW
jgi:hypothetical protein